MQELIFLCRPDSLGKVLQPGEERFLFGLRTEDTHPKPNKKLIEFYSKVTDLCGTCIGPDNVEHKFKVIY